jgi:septum formation protein
MNIILASSSTYRKQLLERLLLSFSCLSPEIDETSRDNESPQSLALRLAEQKALAVANHESDALIIGSDQVAWLNGEQLHKPGDRHSNIEQLMHCQGKEVTFYTSIALYNSKTKTMQSHVETYRTLFRSLEKPQIVRYVDHEQAFDCAGGFKMEGLGISLFQHVSGEDPNTLIGLPLIRLINMFEKEGVHIP